MASTGPSVGEMLLLLLGLVVFRTILIILALGVVGILLELLQWCRNYWRRTQQVVDRTPIKGNIQMRQNNWKGQLECNSSSSSTIDNTDKLVPETLTLTNRQKVRIRVVSAEIPNQLQSQAAILDYDQLVLAVDATPTRGGGMIRLKHLKQVYFYSVDWTRWFDFPQESAHQEPDQFELTNAIFAIAFFGPFVLKYAKNYASVVVKFDNTIINGRPCASDSVLLRLSRNFLEIINGTWIYKNKMNDPDMRLVDKFSRRRLCDDNFNDHQQFRMYHHEYEFVDLTDDDANISSFLDEIRPAVPQRFWRR